MPDPTDADLRGVPSQTPDTPPDALLRLDSAVRLGIATGRPTALLRWLDRELDAEGVPLRLSVADWESGLACIDDALRRVPGLFPERVEAIADGWFLGWLRLCRSDGSSAFGPTGATAARRGLMRRWADRLPDPGYTTILDWWFPTRGASRHAPPPLPADCRTDRPLAVLRADWRKGGDFLAVDHREPGEPTRVELTISGRPWLGSRWGADAIASGAGRARPTLWRTQSSADVAEWTFRVGTARITRTALFLRGRSIALLGEQWDGTGRPDGWSVGLGEGVGAEAVDGSRALVLRRDTARPTVRALPIGLPGPILQPTDGSLGAESGRLTLRDPARGPRAWRPLLLSWDAQRDRKPVTWRVLTVTQDRRVCRPDEAFAARVSWGRDETLLIYRSLVAPATRAFLGHQTNCRFLIALFDSTGEVEPLLKVDA